MKVEISQSLDIFLVYFYFIVANRIT